MCAYQGVRHVSYPENFAYVINEWIPVFHQVRIVGTNIFKMAKCKKTSYTEKHV